MENITIKHTWRTDRMLKPHDLSGYAFTAEAGAHTFVIDGFDGQNAVPITGTITATCLNADGVTIPLTGSVSDGIASLTMTAECYAVPGQFDLTIYATNGSAVQAIYEGIGVVRKTETDITTYPTAAIPDLVELVEDVQEVIDSIPQDYTALSDEVQDLKSAVGELMPENFDETAKSTVAVNEGYKIDTLGGVGVLSGSNVKRYAVTAGKLIKIVVANGISPTKYVFKSSNSGVNTNNVGTCHTDYGTIYTEVPTGATYLFVAVNTADTTSGVYDITDKTRYSNKCIICGGIFAFLSGGYLRVRCESTARLQYDNTVVNCSSWVLDTAISDVYLKYVVFDKTQFSVKATPTSADGILGFVYNYKFYPMQKFVFANTIPFENLYQRQNIPTFINERKLDVKVLPEKMSNIVTDYGYFKKYVNAYSTTGVVKAFDETGRAYKTYTVTQNTASLANKKILTIGDSITNRGWYQQRLKTHVPSLEFVGTKQTQNNSILAEGYSGCRADQVLNSATITEGTTPYTNPFWDGSKCDFGYYCQHNNISPDIVIIEFGPNENNPDNYYSAVSNFISTITAYNSAIKVYVIQPFGCARLAATNHINELYETIIKQCVCETYCMTGCTKIPCYYIMVDEYDYTSGSVAYGYNDVNVPGLDDCVHPSELVGFAKIGDQIYNYLGI